jgi:hypothetical protein
VSYWYWVLVEGRFASSWSIVVLLKPTEMTKRPRHMVSWSERVGLCKPFLNRLRGNRQRPNGMIDIVISTQLLLRKDQYLIVRYALQAFLAFVFLESFARLERAPRYRPDPFAAYCTATEREARPPPYPRWLARWRAPTVTFLKSVRRGKSTVHRHLVSSRSHKRRRNLPKTAFP